MWVIFLLAAFIGGIFCVSSLERIEAGEVGVVYSMKDGEPQCKIKRSDFGFTWGVQINV